MAVAGPTASGKSELGIALVARGTLPAPAPLRGLRDELVVVGTLEQPFEGLALLVREPLGLAEEARVLAAREVLAGDADPHPWPGLRIGPADRAVFRGGASPGGLVLAVATGLADQRDVQGREVLREDGEDVDPHGV